MQKLQRSFDKQAEPEFDAKVKVTLERAVITKHNACCMWLLMQEKVPAIQRAKLQAENRELRGSGFQESKVLRPILWQRIYSEGHDVSHLKNTSVATLEAGARSEIGSQTRPHKQIASRHLRWAKSREPNRESLAI